MTIKNIIDNIIRSEDLDNSKVFDSRGKLYTYVNSYVYIFARRQPELYKDMDGIFVDGIWLCKFIRLFRRKKITRRSFDMTSMAKEMFERLDDPGCDETIYFIGSKPEQVKASVECFSRAYPNMLIAGYRDGYFNSDDERREAARKIAELNPDFTVVGMGMLAQEKFSNMLREAGYKGSVFTCGGFLHQSTENVYYYPRWIDRFNLRSFYRFAKEGTWNRMFDNLLRFPPLFIKDHFSRR